MRNMHGWDRFVRWALAIALAEGAYFWWGGTAQVFAGVLAAVMALTALWGFCPLYLVLGRSGVGHSVPFSRLKSLLGAGVLLAGLVAGSYASAFVTRKQFLEDFNAMNHHYKQTLFLTGKGQREEAVRNLDEWARALTAFEGKYRAYLPHALKGDRQFLADVQAVAQMMRDADPLVRNGDLHHAHLDLEKVRPVFQDLFKRNGLSLLAVALVDFHDAMEDVLDAAKVEDAAKVLALYPGVSDKLKAVESQAQDNEIGAIRTRLEAVKAAAEAGTQAELPALSEQLKSSFVKVYLKRG